MRPLPKVDLMKIKTALEAIVFTYAAVQAARGWAMFFHDVTHVVNPDLH